MANTCSYLIGAEKLRHVGEVTSNSGSAVENNVALSGSVVFFDENDISFLVKWAVPKMHVVHTISTHKMQQSLQSSAITAMISQWHSTVSWKSSKIEHT